MRRINSQIYLAVLLYISKPQSSRNSSSKDLDSAWLMCRVGWHEKFLALLWADVKCGIACFPFSCSPFSQGTAGAVILLCHHLILALKTGGMCSLLNPWEMWGRMHKPMCIIAENLTKLEFRSTFLSN